MSQYVSPTPVSGFLDPNDPTLFPRLTTAQIAELADRAETLSLSPGDVLFEQGQCDTPFYVVLSGAIDIIDRQPDGDHYFTQCQPGTFAADISMFTGEPTLARGVIAEESSILALPPDALRALVASSAELGDLLLRTMITRREWLMGQGYGNERLIGHRSSGDAFALRELLERNLVPFSWHDIETDDESRVLLDRLGIGADECPVLVRTHDVLRCPTVTQVADELGLRAKVDQRTFDAVVLGAGPAGLAAAVYASSEGISTLVIERFAPGGQAGTSARIENYLGFPTGLSGSDLAQRATLQAWKFGAVISSAHEGCRISASETDGLRPLVLADGQQVRTRLVVLAVGADYRRLPADGAERFEGRGLYYAATHLEALEASGQDVVVVGGGNSAGQAVVKLASSARRIYLVVRRPLTATMSSYLIDRIEAAGNVEIWDGCQVKTLHGDEELEAVTLACRDQGEHRLNVTGVFAMIGASPRIEDLGGLVGLDDKGFIVTGEDALRHPRFAEHRGDGHGHPLFLETTRPDVFAVGDVRSGSTKRVASAVGDGALVVRSMHKALARRSGAAADRDSVDTDPMRPVSPRQRR
ncbi:MAG: FAD-dependent oxidoreductase [Actinomycetota bacterium]|nr:FAD-dependent oxidoreductase [Actinomycetota bacterium]